MPISGFTVGAGAVSAYTGLGAYNSYRRDPEGSGKYAWGGASAFSGLAAGASAIDFSKGVPAKYAAIPTAMIAGGAYSAKMGTAGYFAANAREHDINQDVRDFSGGIANYGSSIAAGGLALGAGAVAFRKKITDPIRGEMRLQKELGDEYGEDASRRLAGYLSGDAGPKSLPSKMKALPNTLEWLGRTGSREAIGLGKFAGKWGGKIGGAAMRLPGAAGVVGAAAMGLTGYGMFGGASGGSGGVQATHLQGTMSRMSTGEIPDSIGPGASLTPGGGGSGGRGDRYRGLAMSTVGLVQGVHAGR